VAEQREQSDPVAELIKAAEHVLTESERVRDSKSSARFRRALGNLATAVDAAKKNRTT